MRHPACISGVWVLSLVLAAGCYRVHEGEHDIAFDRIPIGVRCAFDVAPEPLFR